MAVRLFLLAAIFALAAAAQAQTPPGNPSLPGSSAAGNPAPLGKAGPGARHRPPAQQNVHPPQRGTDPDTRRIQSETDELYREIMRRSAPPTER